MTLLLYVLAVCKDKAQACSLKRAIDDEIKGFQGVAAKLYLWSGVTSIVCLKDKQIVKEFVLILGCSFNEELCKLSSEILISNSEPTYKDRCEFIFLFLCCLCLFRTCI